MMCVKKKIHNTHVRSLLFVYVLDVYCTYVYYVDCILEIGAPSLVDYLWQCLHSVLTAKLFLLQYHNNVVRRARVVLSGLSKLQRNELAGI